MSRTRVIHCLLGLILFLGMVGGLGGDKVVQAAPEVDGDAFWMAPNQEEPPTEERLEVIAEYPVLKGRSGESFEFTLELRWRSDEYQEFDLDVSGLPRWNVSTLGGLGQKVEMTSRVGLQPLEPGTTYPTETVYVELRPLEGYKPEPGEYSVTFELSAGEIHEVVELTAIVTALYQFDFYPVTGRLNLEAEAGEENFLKIWVENTGSATLDTIRLSSGIPEGWNVEFDPGTVESLEPGLAQEVTVTIKPPRTTIAGDYAITIFADSEVYSPDPLKFRATVLTPTIWGWVGILIVLAVIAGLAVIFRRLGRR